MAEQGREKLNESANKLDELKKRWNERLTLDNLDLTERYLKFELGVHVHLRYRVLAESGRDSVDFCAIFQRERELGHDDADALRRRYLGETDRGRIGVGIQNIGQGVGVDGARVRHADGHQELVFVRDVELVELPERVDCSLVPFGFLYEIHRSLRHSLYLSSVVGFKNIGTPEDGECGIVGDALAPGAEYLANEQIEAGTEVVDAISYDCAPRERRLFGDFDPPDQISRIRLVITNGSVRLVLLEPRVPGLEVTEVMFGPFDLYPNPGEVGLAGHDLYNEGVMGRKRSKLT